MSLSTRLQPVVRQLQWKASRWRRAVARLDDLPSDAAAVLVSVEGELPQTQIYAFHAFASHYEQAIGTRLHEIDLVRLEAEASHAPLPQVQWVGFQAPLNCQPLALLRQVETLNRLFPNATLVYFDWYAPLDLRHAEVLDPFISQYVKKQVFSDLGQYRTSTFGDTNLMDYFGKQYGLDYADTQFEIPPGFERKLSVGTNFCISPHLLDRFLSRMPEGEREIDLHARIAVKGTDWYQKMRQDARDQALALQGLRIACDGRVSRPKFFQELEHSKICFSPFGYGEVCWRDFEAIAAGALLLKPRMDHVRMEPNIFIDGQTYVAIEWDGSDLEEKVRRYLGDETERLRITRQAHATVQRYLRDRPFVDAGAKLFTGIDPGMALRH